MDNETREAELVVQPQITARLPGEVTAQVLPPRTRVRFGAVEVTLDAAGDVVVRTDGALLVLPQAANCVHLREVP